MTTEQFLEVLRSPTRKELNVSMRQAVAHFLYKNNTPVAIIARSMRMTRGTIYNSIYRQASLMECNDKLAMSANDEIANHKIVVRPKLVGSDVCIIPAGYALVIDNVIF